MKFWNKPKIVISKCLNDHPCRYNGESSQNKLVSRLKPFVEMIEVCPEGDIGLETPRNPIRLVEKEGKISLIDPKTMADYTSMMTEFAEESYIDLKKIKPHGFLLKSKSPSCGLKDTAIYSGAEKGSSTLRKSSGIYGAFIKNHFPLLPVEDDGRINNFSIREEFLIKIFILSSFERVKEEANIKYLVEFHTKNKLLFMGYSQVLTKKLGKILANHELINYKNLILLYEIELLKLISMSARYTSMINVFTHAYGYFSNMLRSDEKTFFFEVLEKYRSGKCPKCVVINLLKGYAIRFNNQYMLNQSLLDPYPEELMDFSDSGKGIVRD